MPTQHRAICSQNLPRLSRYPLIPSHDGSAAAAAAHKSAALLHSVERLTAFRNKATTLASSSSCLKTRHVVNVFSEADFDPTSRTSIFSMNFTAFCKKSTALRSLTERQTAANGGKRRRLYYRPPSKYNKTRVIAHWTRKIQDHIAVFQSNDPQQLSFKNTS